MIYSDAERLCREDGRKEREDEIIEIIKHTLDRIEDVTNHCMDYWREDTIKQIKENKQ